VSEENKFLKTERKRERREIIKIYILKYGCYNWMEWPVLMLYERVYKKNMVVKTFSIKMVLFPSLALFSRRIGKSLECKI
jgi:hypothetical protein